MYTLKLTFVGLLCMKLDSEADPPALWVMFPQPQGEVADSIDPGNGAVALGQVPEHRAMILFGEGAVVDERRVGTFHGHGHNLPQGLRPQLDGKKFIELDGDHITLEAAAKTELKPINVETEDPRSFSWVTSISNLLGAAHEFSEPPRFQDELFAEDYRGRRLIARLVLHNGTLSTHSRWGQENDRPDRFVFTWTDADNEWASSGGGFMARAVTVELEVEGKAVFRFIPLSSGSPESGKGGRQEPVKGSLSVNGEDGDVVEVFFVEHGHGEHDANHFRGIYKLFSGLDGVQGVLPGPATLDDGGDGDGTCTPSREGRGGGI